MKTPKAAPAPNDDADASTPMTKTGRQDRRHLRGQASAQRIIDTTIRLIAEEGIAGVTMQRIAREIGSSNALVVFHFGSKEKLFRAVLEYLDEQFARLWEETVNKPGLLAAERVVASIDCARHFRNQHPDWVSVWVVFGSDRQTMQLDRLISLPSDQAYLAQSRTLLAEVARDGGYEGVDTDTLAEGLNYLVQGAWYWDTFNPDMVRSDALHKTAMALLRQAFPRSFPG
ncbi:TetR/AcrR family transcriptional regulator [Sinorhizobium sp. RAC02]|uniref:TetR/AcrR family transcriptional regulator n=1 Tax=Sinorhizobium sp. RAC02 TaxID=1842534 RepID=UPI00083CBD8C|nr:TetR/AcrR family transcriptional regulator [Sinorhizobium sp. RAC02]AOF94350.1 bacterial regulatory s, tetR family protein [Sinorhizobium sp. RAC02]